MLQWNGTERARQRLVGDRHAQIGATTETFFMLRRNTQDEANADAREGVPPAIETQIDENLRRLYQASLDNELPNQLRDLLARLTAQGRTND